MTTINPKIIALTIILSAASIFAISPTDPGSGGGTNTTSGSTYAPPPYVPGLKLAIPPLSGTNLYLKLVEADPAGKYDVYSVTNLASASWNDILQGTNGQTNFILTFLQLGNKFFRAARTDIPVTNTAGMIVQFPNNDVNTTLTSAIISGGPAAAMAVLVNDTNFADARWIPFSAVPYVLLGTNDGTYQVEFGFIGSDGQTNWTSASVTLDTTPPLLVITNPTANFTCKPMIQLKGYSSEPLTSLTFNMTNSQGTNASGEGLVTEQYFDANLFEMTTNWFECLDISLTQGTNYVSLQATDLAGNVTVTNLIYIFNTNGDITPPAITLFWPQDGTQISGTNFTLRGLLDDETASITAQIVSTNGTTNTVGGLVERDGKFWAENLPLNTGTNIVTVTATDAAGNTSVTNINVFPSTVALTINTPSSDQLWNQTLTVTGTIDDASDYTVWVNGAKATLSGTSWTATNVYLPQGGTAVIQARAIANSYNGGNGTGGSGGGPVTYDNLGNPDPPHDNDTELQTNRSAHIYMQSYNSSYNFLVTNYTQIYFTPIFQTSLFGWTNGIGGKGKSHNTTALSGGNLYNDAQTFWPADTWVPTLGGIRTSMSSGVVSGSTNVSSVGPPSLNMECFNIQGIGYFYNSSDHANLTALYNWSAHTMMRYFTGGKSLPLRVNLHQLNATVTPKALTLGLSVGAGGGPYLTWSYGNGISNGVIAGAFGAGINGTAWKVFPDGKDMDITPQVDGVQNYDFSVTAQKYELHIVANSAVPLQPDHVVQLAQFCVGQYLTFTPTWTPSLPSGTQKSPIQWVFGGTFVNNATNDDGEDDYPISSENYFMDASQLNNETTAAWWTSGGFNPQVTYTATVGEGLTFPNGQYLALTVKGQFSMFRPNLSSFQTNAPYYAALVPTNSPNELQLGANNGIGSGGAMAYSLNVNTIAPFSGHANVVQLVNASRALANTTYGGGTQQTTGGQFWADNDPFYFRSDFLLNSLTFYGNNILLIDQPGYGLNYIFGAYPANLCSIADSFNDYVVFKPDGNANNIYVTLGRVFWSWSASTSYTGGAWSSPTYQVNGPSSPDSSDEFPVWPDTLYNVGIGNGN